MSRELGSWELSCSKKEKNVYNDMHVCLEWCDDSWIHRDVFI